MTNENEQSPALRCGDGFDITLKLDADQRAEASALIEQIVEDPEKYAFEIVAMRAALHEIAEDPANAVTYFEDKWRTIAREALGLSPNTEV